MGRTEVFFQETNEALVTNHDTKTWAIEFATLDAQTSQAAGTFPFLKQLNVEKEECGSHVLPFNLAKVTDFSNTLSHKYVLKQALER